jgi:O-antigen/teichoic acid export membrane protein
MRIGQTSAVHFVSQVTTAVLGFIVTLYVAKALGTQGDDVLGVYYVVIAAVIWLRVISGLGVQTALKKRLSGQSEEGRYLVAGILIQLTILTVIAVALLLAEPFLRSYFRGLPLLWIIGVLFAAVMFKFVTNLLDGLHLVHVSSLLTPFERLVRSIIQIGAVFLGFTVAGLIAGYAIAAFIAALVGTVYVSRSVALPTWRHVEDLVSYARFAWLSSVSHRTFAAMDTIVLGIFVADGFIGVYEVAWNLASILAVFGSSVARSMFPAISQLAEEAELEVVAGLVTDSLRFAGVFLIPGVVGAWLLGTDVLRIYGPEFTKGGTILVLLVAARLVYVFQLQFVNALNAIDRPNLAFRVEAVFIVLNVGLNLVLVYRFGWYGAAIATAVSAGISLLFSYRAVASLLPVQLPFRDVGHQCLASLVMGGVLVVAIRTLPGTLPISIALIFFGAAVYAVVMILISTTLRRTIRRNIPMDV